MCPGAWVAAAGAQLPLRVGLHAGCCVEAAGAGSDAQSWPVLLLPSAQVLPTVGLNLAHFEALGAPLLCWDVGGAAGLRGIWSK